MKLSFKKLLNQAEKDVDKLWKLSDKIKLNKEKLTEDQVQVKLNTLHYELVSRMNDVKYYKTKI